MTAARKARNTFLGNYSPNYRDEKYHSELYVILLIKGTCLKWHVPFPILLEMDESTI